MAKYNSSAKPTTKAFPKDAFDSSSLFDRVEPLLTPELLVSRYLKNIPGIDTYSSDELKDQINLAMNEIEVVAGIHLQKIQKKERIPYDNALYKSFIHIKLNSKPVLSVEKITVESTDGQEIYNMPLTWLETGYFKTGQLNILPIMTTFGSPSNAGIVSGAPSGALIFLQSMINFQFVPGFWSVTYTTGISQDEGTMPIPVNELIGVTTAINILSSLSALNIYNSQSLSQDGISQSSSSQGPAIFNNRIEQLEAKKQLLMGNLRKVFHSKVFLTNI